MIRYTTIGDFIDARRSLTAYCRRAPRCWHGAPVDLEALAERLGRDLDLYRNRLALAAMFRCVKCGGKGATFIIAPP